MRILSWLLGTTARPSRAPARRAPQRATFRPRLEVLEGRITPSTGGSLDPTFGSGGVVTSSRANGTDQAYAVATQPDGRIVVAGYSLVWTGSFSPSIQVMEVARYNSNGTLDATFGTGGFATTQFNQTDAYAQAVALQSQPDGTNKILAAGTVQKVSGGVAVQDFGLVRYNANGTLDATFGTAGRVVTDLGSTNEQPTSMAVQPDGKIVLAGYTNTAAGVVAALVRYNANGSLDTTFGAGGKLITAIQVSYETGVAVQPQADHSFKLVIAGGTTVTAGSTTTHPLFAARLNADGTPDTAFGAGGEVITPQVGKNDFFGGLAVQSDSKIIVAGSAGLGSAGGHLNNPPLVVRYTANGTPDTSFGPRGDGTVVASLPAGPYYTWTTGGVAVQADGQIVVGGNTSNVVGMMRLNGDHGANGPAGTMDSGYGTAGWVLAPTTYGDSAATRRSQTVALEPDGRAVIVGFAEATSSGNRQNIFVACFLASAPQVGSFTANPNPGTAGNAVTLTAGGITDGNPGAAVTQVAFYVDSNKDGTLEPGTDALLGYATLYNGVWTFTFTPGWAPGTYTLFAQAKDSDGVLGDPLSLTFTMQ